ncbi:hypothetical protein BCR32DRAFT_281938 [Anaeromyces robustus]|uniref:Uncharacterized protein n=1 Tax=Anaeromyces robustus TaxID=1754192 RepID=A0A1Y1X033_9FUNG|nr:hypothetical protein BCR32DRAFT_281938 [Anaeromyces robustus]|eukprot:ORX78806.1 hypothetical protein BCR32DRAFT_281938 [Anaeromyces robustus]
MKNFYIAVCFLIICTLQLVCGKAVKKEYAFPLNNSHHIPVNGNEYLQITTSKKFFDKNGNMSLVDRDVYYTECIYNVVASTVTCKFNSVDTDYVKGKVQEYNNKYTVTYTVEANDKKKCLAKNNPAIKAVKVYTYNKDTKKYVQYPYAGSYDYMNNKIEYQSFLNKIQITTKNNCAYELKVKKSTINAKVSKKN